MTFLRKKSVFAYLLFTYISAVVFISVVIGMFTYQLATKLYNKQLEEQNIELLNQYKALIESQYLEVAEQEAVSQLFNSYHDAVDLFLNSEKINNINIFNLHHDVVAERPIQKNNVSDIMFLNPTMEAILSRNKGLTLLKTYTYSSGQDWLRDANQWEEHVGWNVVSRNGSLCLRYLMKYPASDLGKRMGYIVVEISTDKLAELLSNLNKYQESTLLLLDEENKIIPVTGMEYGLLLEQMPDLEMLKRKQGGGQNLTGDEETYYITAATPFHNGWSLARITPVKEFYASMVRLQQYIFWLMLLAIFAGIGISLFFSHTIYRPVKSIMGKLQKIGETNILKENQLPFDEYAFIDDAILHLHSTVDYLKRTLEQNRPLLEYNILSGLLNRTLTDKNIMEQRFGLIGFEPSGNRQTAVVIRLNNRVMEVLDEKNVQLLKFGLIEKIKAVTNYNCIVGEYRHQELVALIYHDQGEIADIIEKIIALLDNNILNCIASGMEKQEVLSFADSYKEACDVLKYAYFMPDKIRFSCGDFADRIIPEEDILGTLIQGFQKQLKMCDIQAVQESLSEIQKLMTGDTYTYYYMNQKQLELVRVFVRYCREMALSENETVPEERFWDTDNIYDFFYLYRKQIEDSLNIHGQQIEQKIEIAIQTICEYIDSNLEEDLSLSRLARMVGLSTGHLSRMFKEIMDQNINNYVTQKRMEEARRLIVETSLNIEDIGKKVGYGTPHYFGAKFKETYGYTPKHYRMMYQKGDN